MRPQMSGKAIASANPASQFLVLTASLTELSNGSKSGVIVFPVILRNDTTVYNGAVIAERRSPIPFSPPAVAPLAYRTPLAWNAHVQTSNVVACVSATAYFGVPPNMLNARDTEAS